MADEPVTWNAFRSQSREVGMNVQMKPWMIRTLRLTKVSIETVSRYFFLLLLTYVVS